MSFDDRSGADPIVRPLDRTEVGDGLLAGVRFAVKELFDVAGEVTTAGNPSFAALRSPAEIDSPAVAALLGAGATLVGTTVSDELAYSLAGTNVHHGTPVNPAAPGHLPGGSSVGSAVAVASGRCDVALGTDTGGSIRVPASYCGIWGMRPTHGRIPLDGVVPLAPSFDTVGWFAADPVLLARAGGPLLDLAPAVGRESPRRLVVVDELLGLADDAASVALRRAAETLAARSGLELEVVREPALDGWWGSTSSAWLAAFRAIQGAEAWRSHGSFVSGDVAIGPGVRSRFEAGGAVAVDELAAAVAVREAARRALEAVTANGGRVLLLPSASGVAPPIELVGAAKEDLRRRTLTLCCGAGLGGLPAVSVPLARVDGLPVGLCLVGAPWSDEALLELVAGLGAGEGSDLE